MLKPKILPSSAAFMLGDLVVTEYANGCLRCALASAYGVKDPSEIADINQRVGATHEAYYARKLSSAVFGAEVPIKGEIMGVPFSGRADFITLTASGSKVIHETKGTVAQTTKKSVITDGHYKLNWLAQLVFYMSRTNTTKGKIVSGFYKECEDNLFSHQEGREFKVEIVDNGNINVDDNFSGFHIQDQLAHQTASAKVMSENIIWDRPDGAEKAYGSPCYFCHLKVTCREYDLGVLDTVDQFIDHAIKQVEGVKK